MMLNSCVCVRWIGLQPADLVPVVTVQPVSVDVDWANGTFVGPLLRNLRPLAKYEIDRKRRKSLNLNEREIYNGLDCVARSTRSILVA